MIRKVQEVKVLPGSKSIEFCLNYLNSLNSLIESWSENAKNHQRSSLEDIEFSFSLVKCLEMTEQRAKILFKSVSTPDAKLCINKLRISMARLNLDKLLDRRIIGIPNSSCVEMVKDYLILNERNSPSGFKIVDEGPKRFTFSECEQRQVLNLSMKRDEILRIFRIFINLSSKAISKEYKFSKLRRCVSLECSYEVSTEEEVIARAQSVEFVISPENSDTDQELLNPRIENDRISSIGSFSNSSQFSMISSWSNSQPDLESENTGTVIRTVEVEFPEPENSNTTPERILSSAVIGLDHLDAFE